MSDNIYEILNSSSFDEDDYENIDAALTDIEIKNIKNNFRKKIKTNNKKKYAYIAASLALIITIGTFSVKPAFADPFIESIPLIDSLYEKLGYYNEFKDFSSYIGLSQEKDGYKFTIDKLMADDENVMVALRIFKPGLNKNKDKNDKKVNNFNVSPLVSNGSFIFMGSDNDSTILNDDTTLIVTKLEVAPAKKVPKRLDMNLIIRNQEIPNLYVKFLVPVSRESTIRSTITKNSPGKIKLGNIDTVKIDRLKISPLNTSIKFSLAKGDKDPMDFEFYLFDDKGRIYNNFGARSDDSGYYITDFTKVEKDAKKLYIYTSLTNRSDAIRDDKQVISIPEDFQKARDLATLRSFHVDNIGTIKINKIEKNSDNIKFHFNLDDPKNLLKAYYPINLAEKHGDNLEMYIHHDYIKFYKDPNSKEKDSYILEYDNIDNSKTYGYNVTFPFYKTLSQGAPLEIDLK
ncbi:DUF4179 domain-containing protein [Clostridium manihotivorum]|uniref:DUF4179 domain-containing protein n=1 Tax=Clostridium manihotivorum TaxID=2320868 RepID=A0A3R5QRJ3_9CLOT|nr:DUF4179 domain-containing protein [Clostridium manihotivorum]QAA30778.1 hypothetical protein C1I91_03405 [Clostridium manihotivorum]